MINKINKSGQDNCPDLFCINSPHIEEGLLGKNIIAFEQIDSTNTFLKANQAVYPEGTIVIAKEQTNGRGRLGRSWSSSFGEGIWMSFLLRPEIKPENCSGLTLVVALSLAKALRELTGFNLLIKWPNDIVCNGKKIAGILTEMSAGDAKVDYVVVGVGINVNTEHFPEEIKEVATSLKLEGGSDFDFDTIINSFCKEFNKDYLIYINTGDMSKLRKEYETLLVNMGQKVSLIEDGKNYVGVATGINNEGELLFLDDFGEREIRAGEVSVRGVYGYV